MYTLSFRELLLVLSLTVLAGCGSGRLGHPYEVRSYYGTGDPQFIRTMDSLLGPPLVDGNAIKPLVNGVEIFPEMLAAVRGARETINFETFIYWRGDIARQFAEALSERARSGVETRLIIDAVGGARMEKPLLDMMKVSGVDVRLYHPVKSFGFWHLARINNRTHRKLLIVDGRIGFTGGVGIADEWTGNADSPKHWRDTHFRIEGPAVAHLQTAFLDNWIEITGEVLHDERFYPRLDRKGETVAQVFMSSFEGGSASMQLMYMLAIAAATERIRLATAYFVPDEQTVKALVQARNRGVDIQIITPGPIVDYETVRKAGRATWGPLLEAGVRFFEYQPTLYHCKLMVIDDRWVSIGSANFDNRSFKLNDEANLNVMDRAFARRMTEIFDQDKAHSREITLEEWKNEPLHRKALKHAASILAPQL